MKKYSFEIKELAQAYVVLSALEKKVLIRNIELNTLAPIKHGFMCVISCSAETCKEIERIALDETCVKLEVFRLVEEIIFP